MSEKMAEQFKIDLTNFKDRVGSKIDPGTYRVVVDDVEVTKAKSGKGMMNVWLRVQGGQFDGSTIVDRLMLEGNAMFRLVNFLNALGIPTPRKQLSFDAAKFLNRPVDVEVKDGEPYNGNVKSEVQNYARVSKAEKQSESDLGDDLDTAESEEAADVAETAEKNMVEADSSTTTGQDGNDGQTSELGITDAPAADVDLDDMDEL